MDIDGVEQYLYSLFDEGKYVFMDLYTIWCQPYRDNAPFVEEWYEDHGPNGNRIVLLWNVECDDSGIGLRNALDWIEEFFVRGVNFEENEFFL